MLKLKLKNKSCWNQIHKKRLKSTNNFFPFPLWKSFHTKKNEKKENEQERMRRFIFQRCAGIEAGMEHELYYCTTSCELFTQQYMQLYLSSLLRSYNSKATESYDFKDWSYNWGTKKSWFYTNEIGIRLKLETQLLAPFSCSSL